MKSLLWSLIFSFALFSCSKKDDTTSAEGIQKIKATYFGPLSWKRTTGGQETSGTDANASFSITYKDKTANVVVTTTAPIENKSYAMALTSPETDKTGYIFHLYEKTDQTVNNSALLVTMAESKIFGQLDFNKTGNNNSEIYSLNGATQQK